MRSPDKVAELMTHGGNSPLLFKEAAPILNKNQAGKFSGDNLFDEARPVIDIKKLKEEQSLSPTRPANQTGFSLCKESLKYDFAMRPYLDRVEKELMKKVKAQKKINGCIGDPRQS